MSFDVTNSGKRQGAEVAQVFVADTGSGASRPPKELKEFVKVGLKPGETQHVTVPLGTRSFAYYDANSGVWQAEAGTYRILVGKSTEEIEPSGKIKLARTVAEKP